MYNKDATLSVESHKSVTSKTCRTIYVKNYLINTVETTFDLEERV